MFEELKENIMSQPVLLLPRREGKFRVEMDASGHAIGGVLSQEQDGKWKPIAFLSRTMQPAERNYEIYNKELLAIVETLTKWRQYLLDVAETFEIWMDVIYKSTCPENYIPTVMPPLNHTSPPSMAATFLATRLMAVLQPSGYSVFHGGDTPIQLSLP